MKTLAISPLARWALRGVILLTLLLGLMLATAAHAQSGSSTITLYAPGAPAGAWTGVQWQDRAGNWHDVAAWQSAIDMAEESNMAFKQWAVYPQDYGRGPFRWVVWSEQGGEVLVTSNNFFLPDGDGAALALTLTPRNAAGAAGGPTEVGAVPFDFSTITLHAPGAPAGAPVGVQWQDGTGNWHPVEGWQSTLDTARATGEPFKQWAVYPQDYGQGPFRWIVFAEGGDRVLATSPRFFLPNGDDAGLTMTVLPKIAVTPADTLLGELAAPPMTLPATTSTDALQCSGGTCDFSVISLSVPDALLGSQVGVQWQDPFGLWHDVPSWRSSLTMSGGRSAPYQQWTISPELQGRGPFRWVIYNPLGDTVLGITPGFMLPDRSGVNLNLSVPADLSDIAA